jgi:spermidine/putrescine-binding protein
MIESLPAQPRQDAHEFLNYLLNECSELLEKEAKARAEQQGGSPPQAAAAQGPFAGQRDQQPPDAQPAPMDDRKSSVSSSSGSGSNNAQKLPPTWIHELFQVPAHCAFWHPHGLGQ